MRTNFDYFSSRVPLGYIGNTNISYPNYLKTNFRVFAEHFVLGLIIGFTIRVIFHLIFRRPSSVRDATVRGYRSLGLYRFSVEPLAVISILIGLTNMYLTLSPYSFLIAFLAVVTLLLVVYRREISRSLRDLARRLSI